MSAVIFDKTGSTPMKRAQVVTLLISPRVYSEKKDQVEFIEKCKTYVQNSDYQAFVDVILDACRTMLGNEEEEEERKSVVGVGSDCRVSSPLLSRRH